MPTAAHTCNFPSLVAGVTTAGQHSGVRSSLNLSLQAKRKLHGDGDGRAALSGAKTAAFPFDAYRHHKCSTSLSL